MQRDSDEDAWRAIVENYGDRANLDEDQPDEPVAGVVQTEGLGADRLQAEEPVELPRAADPDRFVPPPPPPLPRLPPDRLLAWGGLFGAPALLLISLVLGIGLPSWLGFLLVTGFIGGFVYLVVTMPRGSDVDPWDDGARI